LNKKKDVNALCTKAVGIGRQQEIVSKKALSVTLDDELKSLITHRVREDKGLNWRGVRSKWTNQKSSVMFPVAGRA
jgi:hypothetical protein